MIKDALLTQLVAKQEELFRTGNSAQRENVLMQIQERQKELKKINGGGV